MKLLILLGIFGCASVVMASGISNSARLDGDNTVFDASPTAFSNPLPLLSADERARFERADALFDHDFTPQTGLGPVFNAASCDSCHQDDGRGRPPNSPGETGTGLLIRLALNQQHTDGSTFPDPVYGGQFQDMGTGRTRAEGTVNIIYHDIHGTYADGTPYTLRAPTYQLTNLQYGSLNPQTTLSPRLASQMIGLGSLEAVPDAELLALADPNDANGDGISGRPNYVWDTAKNGIAIGRFGWKANQPTLLQQTAAAFNGDIGLVSRFNAQATCTDLEFRCDLRGRLNPPPPRGNDGNRQPPPPPRGANGNPPPYEITDQQVQLAAFYSSSLAVPAQRTPDDPQVLRGQALFAQAACSSCHISQLQTGIHPSIAALSNQTIHPYTDLLLHDMGPGLVDGQINFQASGSEWRTAPLWGIGLLDTVNGYAYYLHDGRAHTLEEAILWHGGEAAASQQAFVNMSQVDRAALIAFLKSL